MSLENARNFYENIVKDNLEIQQQLDEVNGMDQFLQKAVDLGQQNGYTFTTEEAAALLEQLRETEGELSNAELEAVAGGKGSSCPLGTKFTFCVFISSCWGSKC